MATRLFPFQAAPSLAFPAGRAPGFDPTHPAAQSISNGFGFSAAALQKTYINLVSGKIFAGTATLPTPTILGGIGACNFFNSTAVECNIPGQNTATPPGITVAAIVQFAGTGDGSFCAAVGIGDNITGHAMQFGMAGTSKNVYFYNNAASTSSFALSLNTPYFIAASALPSSTVNFVATNLATGQTFNGTTTTGAAFGSATSAPQIGLDIGDSHTADAYIATAMFAPAYMPMPMMLAWAADPWSFWYPQPYAPQFKVPQTARTFAVRSPVETRYVRRDTFDVSLRSQADVYQYAPLLQIQPSPAQNQNYDWPNPLVPGYSIELRTWLQQSAYSLVTVMPPIQNNWPPYKPQTTVPVQWIWPTPAVMITPAFGTGKRRPLFIAGRGGFPPSYWPDGNG